MDSKTKQHTKQEVDQEMPQSQILVNLVSHIGLEP